MVNSAVSSSSLPIILSSCQPPSVPAVAAPPVRLRVVIQWIDTARKLEALVKVLLDAPLFALDTEFHTERSYWPHLALVQVAWPGGIALVDPLAVDPTPLGKVLAGSSTMVVHAADQDLGILEHVCGRLPTKLFDTQVAAGFLGFGTPSLASLAEKLLGVRLAKGDRLADWTRRPLSDAQRAYASADVEHLLPLHDELTQHLEEAGRLPWALDECEERRLRTRGRPEPEEAWWRIKGGRQLRGRSRGVAQALAAWRERAAEAADVPPRFVLPDLALAGIVQRPPRDREELAAVRGLDGRHLRSGAAGEILAAVAEGLALEPEQLRIPVSEPGDRTLAPAVTIVGAWLAQRAAELDLDPALLATRADVTAMVFDGHGRLSTGWRAELVGDEVRRLVAGEAVVTLASGGRRLALEERR